ncbi:protein shisa-5 isoform X2 [Rhineura floridana]|uniref:protein shisa-5 isoform X2 n=1 Tax=Rhineura floridana TaxID=261503 RepID=UPI002AC7F033|nr:protein shisa-5 isoform X2 [Rhineura floridana]
MACAQSPSLVSYAFLLLFLLPPGGVCEECKAYTDSNGHSYSEISCPAFCCGRCTRRYCCSDSFLKLDEYDQLDCALLLSGRGTVIAVGISVFVLFVVTTILCFTCSCCCLYKACRRQPRPVVTTTTATTVVQVPYPQQPGIPQGYPGGVYQGYNPLPVQPQHGMAPAPYPTQYPPPYPTQPAGPPAYNETMAGAGVPVIQPPYNPAYMDPPKH